MLPGPDKGMMGQMGVLFPSYQFLIVWAVSSIELKYIIPSYIFFFLLCFSSAYLCCTKCRYSTCCSKAMAAHVSIFHSANKKPAFELGIPILLDKDIFCCCGFKTHSGNKMGK